MTWNLLANLAEKTRQASVGEAALYALLGFLTVFVGICVLIFCVWLVGKIITKATSAKSSVKKQVKTDTTAETIIADTEEISEETVAAITAAIMAYYQEQPKKCEFTVKRIKKA